MERARVFGVLGWALALLGGCLNADPVPAGPSGDVPAPGSPGGPVLPPEGGDGDAQVARPAPADDLPVATVELDHPAMRGVSTAGTLDGLANPPPIQGGTLLVLSDGATAVASDPDHDRVHVVDLVSRTARSIDLERGSEPGRVVEDGAGGVHVVLRRAGAVQRIDVEAAAALDARPVCPAPHGIAYDGSGDVLHVACESGELVTLPTAEGHATRVLRIAAGLRDVVVDGERLRVSDFKSATLFELDADGTIVASATPETVTSTFEIPDFPFQVQRDGPVTMVPAVAWRTLSLGDGSSLIVHQRGMEDEIEIGAADGTAADADAGVPLPTLPGGNNAYGGGFGCAGIVQATATVVGAAGSTKTLPAIGGMVLPVDGAVGPGGQLALIAAGTNALSPRFGGPPFSLVVLGADQWDGEVPMGDCLAPGLPGGTLVHFTDAGQAIGVGFGQDGTIVVQSRSPNAISLYEIGAGTELNLLARIPLGPASIDLGHDLYHLGAGAGLACASCHPGGADDGRTWVFSGLGGRRSQSSNIGLQGTEPFHWDGSLPDVTHLMDEVFVGRMGGVPMTAASIASLEHWLFALQPPARVRQADDEAAMRGRALFESAEVGCADCHSGDKLTNNESHDVGTGDIFQVPSLVGVAYRVPVMHDGCATTLRERFDTACGGGAHGNIEHLAAGEIDDLVAYLESL